EGKTTYLAPVGDRLIFPLKPGPGDNVKGVGELAKEQIGDGPSGTILVVDTDDDRAVTWTKPDDLVIDPLVPEAGLGGRYKAGFLALFADGGVHFLPAAMDPVTLYALFTPNGNEKIRVPDEAPLLPFLP